ncbi:Helix-turn-helix domain-containing protein [Methylobacterium sp. UNC378MF]|uniref:helix-turn-helix domain-containing protein n=1 Tax=Methylobacterium sp. UNC378MF TaxID=1502748 RepID=UPI00088957F8|nr:helix-turn-helix domain-containing protein [Methylobacterium sp. UNC378MF]SDA12988.1 Helix-turn-helix domain-containing protein [Methylobacterium sp. UNC378MF]
MSIEAIHYVMKTDIPDGIAKLVAFVIADYAHAETGQAWPKVETLARKCSQSVRTVQRKIRVLEDLGILRVEQRHAETGRQRENLFVLYLPGVPRPAANDLSPPRSSGRPKRGEGDTQSPIPPPDPVTLGGVTAVTPEGDTAVTPRGIPQKESTRRESSRRETRDSSLPPASAHAATAPKGAPSPRAVLCPDGFAPEGRHYAAAEALGFDAAFVRQTAASMHRWSHANAHRPIARKSDWALAFDGILDTALREAAERAARETRRSTTASASPRRSTNGGLALVAEMIGLPHEPADLLDVLGLQSGRAPAAPDAGVGSLHRAVHEPAGGHAGLLPAQASARRFGA